MTPPKRSKNNKWPHRVTRARGKFYYLKPIIKNGKATTQWVPLGASEPEMLKRLAELKSTGIGLMSAIIERYRDEILPKKAGNTQTAQSKQLDRLNRAFGHMRPSDLKPVHVAKYHDLVGKDAPYQANRELALITHVCKYAVRWGLMEDNPCREIQRFPEYARERYISDAEFVAVRDVAPAWIGIVMDLAYLTGQRRIDILAMKRSQITAEGITIVQSKTKASLLLEWSPPLREAVQRAIDELHSETSSVYLICDKKGQKRRDGAFTTAWTRLMDKCMEKGLIAEKFQFRDIRGKAGSDSSGEQLGHKSKATLHRHYKRLPKHVKPTK